MSIPLPALCCPASRLVIEQSHINHPQSKLYKHIKDHPFNFMLETFIPNCRNEEANLNYIGSSKYFEARIQISSLIHKAFIEAFIKRGTLQLLSCHSKIDDEDVISLSPSGHLVLHLTKQSYQQLGIDGKPSAYNVKKGSQSKYVVEIDLTKPFFQPGKKNYENARNCFAERHTQYYNVMFTWTPMDESIAPVSVCRYFQSIGYKCKEMDVELSSQDMPSVVTCPVLNPHHISDETEGCADYLDLWEWLGAVSCDVNVREKDNMKDEDLYVSTYTCPQPHQHIQGVFRETVTGLISITDILSRLEHLREHSPAHGWCVLTVHGFTDAPVSWGSKEHGFLMDGDNIYSIVLFSDGTYWLISGLGSHDACP